MAWAHSVHDSIDLCNWLACVYNSCTFCRLAEELFLLNRAALMARKERMRDQLLEDYRKAQQELAARGFAIASGTD